MSHFSEFLKVQRQAINIKKGCVLKSNEWTCTDVNFMIFRSRAGHIQSCAVLKKVNEQNIKK